MSNSDGPNMWKVIQTLNGTPDTNSPSEVMPHNGCTITNIKANIFVNHYGSVSKLNMSKADHDLNCHFKKQLDAPSIDDESCASFQMDELFLAIKKMATFPQSFLKSLGPLALQELLFIFNLSFFIAHCPRIWRVAIIIPLLKAGKSPLRPINFTSCVTKLLERILADSLYYMAETKNWLSRFQSGYRAVKEATTIATNTILHVSLSSSFQVVNEKIYNSVPTQKRIAQVYQQRKASRDSVMNWQYDVHLVRLWSSHHPFLHQYVHWLDPAKDPLCPSCHLEEQDLTHWLYSCLEGNTIRQRVFGYHEELLEWLATRPGNAVAYPRKTLVILDALPSKFRLAHKHRHKHQ